MSIYVDHSNFTCMRQPDNSMGGASANMSDAASQPVDNPVEFMAALAAQAASQQAGVGIIALSNSIALGPDNTVGYRLPLNISANRTLCIEGGERSGHAVDKLGWAELAGVQSKAPLLGIAQLGC